MKTDKLIEKIDVLKNIMGKWHKVDEIPAIERDIILQKLRDIYDQLRMETPQSLVVGAMMDDEEIERLEESFTECCGDESMKVWKEHEHENHRCECDNTKCEEAESDKCGEQDDENESNECDKSESERHDQHRHEAHTGSQPDFDESTPESSSKESELSPKSESELKEPAAHNNEKRQIFGQEVPSSLIDRFILELFWRDEHFFDDEVAKLDNLPSLDSALFYISEKYNWRADSEAAGLFTELLINKEFES